MPLNHTSKYAELTAEQAELLGRFVLEWSNIEFLLGQLLGRLLLTPDFLSRVYADEMGAYQFQSAVDKAIRIHRNRYDCMVVSQDTLDRIDALRPKVDRLRGMRNRFSHFCWVRYDDDSIFGTGFSAFLPGDKRIQKDNATVTVGDLKLAHKEAWDLVHEIEQLIHEVPECGEQETVKAKRRS